jgi:hypothetical protein
MVRKELAVLVLVHTWKRRSNPNAVGHRECKKLEIMQMVRRQLAFDQEAAGRYIELLPHD